MNKGWLIYWGLWGFAFVIGEGIALVRDSKGDTLSEQVWRWLKVTPGKRVTSAALYRFPVWFVGVLLIWLFFHFEFGLGA